MKESNDTRDKSTEADESDHDRIIDEHENDTIDSEEDDDSNYVIPAFTPADQEDANERLVTARSERAVTRRQ